MRIAIGACALLLTAATLTGCSQHGGLPPEFVWQYDYEGAAEPIEFEGVVLERGPPPGCWAGLFLSFQGVRYKVTRVLAGPVTSEEIVVFHAVVGPPLCEPDRPELSRTVFKVGNPLRVKGERNRSGYFFSWESPSNVQVLSP
jgi:hypothetical protein